MQRIEADVKPQGNEHLLQDSYRDVNPADLDNLRQQAAVFLTERPLTQEELDQIHKKSALSMRTIDFPSGLSLERTIQGDGDSVIELFEKGDNVYKIISYPGKMVRTQRGPLFRALKFLKQ